MTQDTISIHAVLEMLKPLSADSKRWLADRLYQEAEAKQESCGLDKALKDAHSGKRYHYDNVEDAMKALME